MPMTSVWQLEPFIAPKIQLSIVISTLFILHVLIVALVRCMCCQSGCEYIYLWRRISH
jgi:hypothetical protein